ncbi:hypothetical protein [Pseudomonas sp. P7548]|uniref:hypothetical protein n=1 Tax=Pseudomonas sp. P7548 TaxID=2726981 RepID=UPI0015BC97BA|nr:hypothetical protein [Pseudomonas sp. P7548]NWE20406.1 hypothetical protein [Pseudomonas sp. P7548]
MRVAEKLQPNSPADGYEVLTFKNNGAFFVLGERMNIEFYWSNFLDEPAPNCRSGVDGPSGVDFLACLLGDDGGRCFNTMHQAFFDPLQSFLVNSPIPTGK